MSARLHERLHESAADRLPACFTAARAPDSLPVHAARGGQAELLCARLPEHQAAYLRASGFDARAGQVTLLPAPGGIGGAVLGLGEETSPHVWGALPGALPGQAAWHLDAAIADPPSACLGFGLGAYRFTRYAGASAPAPRLALPDGVAMAETLAALRAAHMARDLINTPANELGPAELAGFAQQQLADLGAHVEVIEGSSLTERFPLLHAVGASSARAPAAVVASWQAPDAAPGNKLISICGKGVCFDSGGYDVKSSAGMLRMKKDMAGAAIALGLACMIIERGLRVRLQLRLGCVENMISGHAMRPLDVLRTRSGLTVEIGNTDAEGRLVLCDLLSEACESSPDMLLDFATLTGAARTALGPDLPALFSNDDVLAENLLMSGRIVHDPVWRLPLWASYNNWLDGSVADMSNVSEKGYAGAIVAGLFLQRFVSSGTKWAHFDVYGWNDTSRPGRPAGGECQSMRAAFEAVKQLVTTTAC